MTESRPFQVFRSRCEYLSQHVQVVDVALQLMAPAIQAFDSNSNINSSENKMKDVSLQAALQVDAIQYHRLTQLPAKQWPVTLLKHSQRRNVEFALGELYAYFEEYVATIVNDLPRRGSKYPNRACHDLEFSSDTVRKLAEGKIDLDNAVGEGIIGKIRKSRYGKGMADTVCEVTGIAADKKLRQFAYFVLDVRNALIHYGGKVSNTLARDYGSLVKKHLGVAPEQQIKLSFNFVSFAIEHVARYVEHLDQLLLGGGYLKARVEPKRR